MSASKLPQIAITKTPHPVSRIGIRRKNVVCFQSYIEYFYANSLSMCSSAGVSMTLVLSDLLQRHGGQYEL
jgi:hypothetical protein